MTTFTFPSGRFQGRINNPGFTVIDAAANDAFFLSDFVQFRASGATGGTLAYPLIIDDVANGAVMNGGRFYGNISYATDWDQFYIGSAVPGGPGVFPRFNSALIFPRNGVSMTFNDQEFGIRDNLDSGYVDGLRTVQAGNTIINRPRVWISRDDFLEADTGGGDVTINDGFFENLFLWLSGTGVIPNKNIRVNRSLVHFTRHRYDGQLQYGAPLKVDNAANSPNFLFNDVCLVIGPSDYTDYNRMKSALANTTATNGCRLLVLGGTHVDRALIQLYQNAGFSVLEDGSGDSATIEWLNRKAAFLDEGSAPPPPVEPPPPPPVVMPATFGSSVTFNVTVMAPGVLTAPTFVGSGISGINTLASSLDVPLPAYDEGDLVVVGIGIDCAAALVAGVAATGPNGEVATVRQVLVDNEAAVANDGQSIALLHYRATQNHAGGATLACSIVPGGARSTEQILVMVDVWRGARATDPLATVARTFSPSSVANALSGAFPAASPDSRVAVMIHTAFDAATPGAPAGWTERRNLDIGALAGYLGTRDAVTSGGETVAAAAFPLTVARPYVALTYEILPQGA
jgi:hypothetical protein